MSVQAMEDWALEVAAGDFVNLVSISCRLFKNNITPAVGDSVGTYTEANFSGYAAVNVTPGSGPTWDSLNLLAVLQCALATFTHNGGATANNIYGFFVTGVDTVPTTHLLIAGVFSPGFVMATNGDQIKVQPFLQYKPVNV